MNTTLDKKKSKFMQEKSLQSSKGTLSKNGKPTESPINSRSQKKTKKTLITHNDKKNFQKETVDLQPKNAEFQQKDEHSLEDQGSEIKELEIERDSSSVSEEESSSLVNELEQSHQHDYSFKRDLDSKAKELEEHSKLNHNLRQELKSKKEEQELNERITKMVQENDILKAQQDRSNKEIHDLKLALDTLNQEFDKNKKLIIDLEKDKSNLKTQSERVTQHKDKLQIDLDSAIKKLDVSSQLNTKLYGDVDGWIKKNQALRDSFNNLLKKETSQKNELEKQKNTLRAELEGVKQCAHNFQQDLTSTKKKLEESQKLKITLEKEKNFFEQQSNFKTEELNKSKKLIEDLNQTVSSLQSQSEKSNQNNHSLRQELTSSYEKLNSTQEKLTSTEEKLTSTEEKLAAFQHRNSNLQQELDSTKAKLKEYHEQKTNLQEANNSLKSHHDILQSELFLKKEDLNALTIKHQKLLSTIYSYEAKSQVPSVSIQTNSILSLTTKDGWKVDHNVPNEVKALENEKLFMLTLIGSTGSGKSWLASQLTGGLLPYGWQNKPNSMTVYYPQKSNHHFCILDPSGWDEPIRSNDAKIKKLLSPLTNDEYSLSMSSEEKKFRQHNKMCEILFDDAKIIEDLKLSFIIEHGGIILLVLGRLTETELEKFQRVRHKIQEYVKKELGKKDAGNVRANQVQLIVVHNFYWIRLKKYVKEEIEKTLLPSFELEEEQMYNFQEANSGDLHKSLWKDQFGVTHLVLAAHDSEAGDYYNPEPLKFLEDKISTHEMKSAFSLPQSFAEFCSQRLACLLEKKDLEIKYEKESLVSVNELTLKRADLISNESHNIYAERGFKPKYSLYCKKSKEDETQTVVVNIETLDGIVNPNPRVSTLKGRTHLSILGRREDIFKEHREEESKGEILLEKGTREDGDFNLRIELPIQQNMEISSKKVENLSKGLSQVTIVFKKAEDIEL